MRLALLAFCKRRIAALLLAIELGVRQVRRRPFAPVRPEKLCRVAKQMAAVAAKATLHLLRFGEAGLLFASDP